MIKSNSYINNFYISISLTFLNLHSQLYYTLLFDHLLLFKYYLRISFPHFFLFSFHFLHRRHLECCLDQYLNQHFFSLCYLLHFDHFELFSLVLRKISCHFAFDFLAHFLRLQKLLCCFNSFSLLRFGQSHYLSLTLHAYFIPEEESIMLKCFRLRNLPTNFLIHHLAISISLFKTIRFQMKYFYSLGLLCKLRKEVLNLKQDYL